MEENFKFINRKNALSRREFLSGVLAAGILISAGSAVGRSSIPAIISELHAKFREMGDYGIEPLVCWTDPTMRKLLSQLSHLNNSAAASQGTEPFHLSGATVEEQFYSLNRWIGKASGSPFGEDSLAILERKIL
jgi:hypothetical protein